MLSKEEIEPLLAHREEQIGLHTDFLLIRDISTGGCGQASCLHVTLDGQDYTISCAHVLKQGAEYYTGPKRLRTNRITENDSHGVPPLRLLHSEPSLDIAIFSHAGLDLAAVPKRLYDLSQDLLTYERSMNGKGAISFIFGTPGFATRGSQYEDGLVFVETPIYTAYGPILSVTPDLILADFAEREAIEINTKDFPRLADFTPTGGARNLGGLSGSGLWVWGADLCGGERFHLAGLLRGRAAGFDPAESHVIEFTPVWRVRECLVAFAQSNGSAV